MSKAAVKQIVLASRPKGLPTHENFHLQEVPMPELPPGGLLLRVLYLSLDPYMRGRMDDRKSYAKPVGLGEVMTGESVCEVIASERAVMPLATSCWRTPAGAPMGPRPAQPCASWIRPWRRSPLGSACSACPASPPMRAST